MFSFISIRKAFIEGHPEELGQEIYAAFRTISRRQGDIPEVLRPVLQECQVRNPRRQNRAKLADFVRYQISASGDETYAP